MASATSQSHATDIRPHEIPTCRATDGVWHTELPLPVPGRYRYKFVVDERRRIDDPSNGMKEPDE